MERCRVNATRDRRRAAQAHETRRPGREQVVVNGKPRRAWQRAPPPPNPLPPNPLVSEREGFNAVDNARTGRRGLTRFEVIDDDAMCRSKSLNLNGVQAPSPRPCRWRPRLRVEITSSSGFGGRGFGGGGVRGRRARVGLLGSATCASASSSQQPAPSPAAAFRALARLCVDHV